MSWPETAVRGADGVLQIGRVSTVALAREFGTPLYLFDESTLRTRARLLRGAFERAYPNSRIVYAGKAYLSPALMRILVEEGVGLDVVSAGEIHAGLVSGVDPGQMTFHGNNKSAAELEFAVSAGVGHIAVDNDHEISLLEQAAQAAQCEVHTVLRLNPGVDPHTHDKMRTGAIDSKFGFPTWDGQADQAAQRVAASPWLSLVGYHAHVGSQIFDPRLVVSTLDVIFAFAARVAKRCGVVPEVIIPGGGFGVADDASGDDVSIHEWADAAASAVERNCLELGFDLPQLVVEPGRSIIGPAGVAIYEVGAIKRIPNARTYVSVDGGMSDNIRPALYGARYSATLANRDARDEATERVSIAGKYCESGDVLIHDIDLPALVPGDLLAVPMAGAYCLAMASNYNLAPRPAAVLVNAGDARLIRRRETFEDLLRTEIVGDEVVARGVVEAGSLSGGKGSL